MAIGWRIARSLAAAARRRQAAARGSRRSDGPGDMIDDYQNYRKVDNYLAGPSVGTMDASYDLMDQVAGGAAVMGYSSAIDMAGNAGQRAIIEQMGVSAFSEAASYHNEGGDAVTALISMCPHPEAVEEILMEAGGVIADEVESGWGDWM